MIIEIDTNGLILHDLDQIHLAIQDVASGAVTTHDHQDVSVLMHIIDDDAFTDLCEALLDSMIEYHGADLVMDKVSLLSQEVKS